MSEVSLREYIESLFEGRDKELILTAESLRRRLEDTEERLRKIEERNANHEGRLWAFSVVWAILIVVLHVWWK